MQRTMGARTWYLEDGDQGALTGLVAVITHRRQLRGSVNTHTRRCATAVVRQSWRGPYLGSGNREVETGDGRMPRG